jgi:hypothetical protein
VTDWGPVERLGVVAAELAAVPAGPRSEPKTVSLYLSAGRELVAHLERTGGPDEPGGLRRGHVEGGRSLELQERGRTPSGVSLGYRSLQQLMNYLGQEGGLERSSREHMTAPIIPEWTTAVLSDDDLRALLATCAARDFDLDTNTVRLSARDAGSVRSSCRPGQDRAGPRAVPPGSAPGPLRRRAGAVARRTQPGAAVLLRRRAGVHPPRPGGRSGRAARAPVPAHGRARLAGGGRQQVGSHARRGVALAADAPPLRRQPGRRAGTRGVAAAESRRRLALGGWGSCPRPLSRGLWRTSFGAGPG